MTTSSSSPKARFWFVVAVSAGREEDARELLAERAAALGIEICIRPGNTDGYLLATLPDDTGVRNRLLRVRGVRGLLGGRRPVTVSEEELAEALGTQGKTRKPPVKFSVRFFKR